VIEQYKSLDRYFTRIQPIRWT